MTNSQQRRFDKLDEGKEQPSIVRSTLTNTSSGGRRGGGGGNKIKKSKSQNPRHTHTHNCHLKKRGKRQQKRYAKHNPPDDASSGGGGVLSKESKERRDEARRRKHMKGVLLTRPTDQPHHPLSAPPLTKPLSLSFASYLWTVTPARKKRKSQYTHIEQHTT